MSEHENHLLSNRTSPPPENDHANTKTFRGGHGRFDPNPFFRVSIQGSASNRPSRRAASAGSTFCLWGTRVRRVALAKPSLPYAKLRRPVGAKSRVPMQCGGDDRGRACGDAIACVMFEVQSALSCRTGGWREDPADGGGEFSAWCVNQPNAL